MQQTARYPVIISIGLVAGCLHPCIVEEGSSTKREFASLEFGYDDGVPHRTIFFSPDEAYLGVVVAANPGDGSFLTSEVPWELVVTDQSGAEIETFSKCEPRVETEPCSYHLDFQPGTYIARINYLDGFVPTPDVRCGDTAIEQEIQRGQRAAFFIQKPPSAVQRIEISQHENVDSTGRYILISLLAEFTGPEPQLQVLVKDQNDETIPGTTATSLRPQQVVTPTRLAIVWSPFNYDVFRCPTCTYQIELKGEIGTVSPIDMTPFMPTPDGWILTVPPEARLYDNGAECEHWLVTERHIYPDALPCALGGCP